MNDSHSKVKFKMTSLETQNFEIQTKLRIIVERKVRDRLENVVYGSKVSSALLWKTEDHIAHSLHFGMRNSIAERLSELLRILY